MIKKIYADGREETITPANGVSLSLEEAQHHVGGMVEQVTCRDGKALLLHEEGKYLDLPYNEKATTILHAAGGMPSDYIAGDALLCESREGEWC